MIDNYNPRSNWDLGVDINLCDLYYQGDWSEDDICKIQNTKPLKEPTKTKPTKSWNRLSWFLASWERYWTDGPGFWEHSRFEFYSVWIPWIQQKFPCRQKNFLIQEKI
jgi:hypothetical protein